MRLACPGLIKFFYYVSIHAPTRGATGSCFHILQLQSFNPRTHEGCDTGLRSWWQPWQSFNPRTHEGCDNGRPACGIDEFSSFNPRTHEGCDQVCNKDVLVVQTFQSTHPRGVRRQISKAKSGSNQFQSTHPRGVRPITKYLIEN